MSRHVFVRRASRIAAAATLAVAFASGPAVGSAHSAPNPNTDGSAASTVDTSSVIVRLSQDPLATSPTSDRSHGRVNPSGAHSQAVRASLAHQRNAFKAWLRTNAPKAQVTGEYDFALNAVAVRLNGTSADSLKKAPGVVSVGYEETYTPASSDDPDLAQIDATQGWTAAEANSVKTDPATWAGYGVKVGIIDTGIDTRHPCFNDAGFPATKQLGDTSLTNNKVIVAKVFNNLLHQSHYDASAVQEHGTHVAGTVACDLMTPAVVRGVSIPYDPSGVAPGAQLGSYNIFPGDVTGARSEDILNALQAAAYDGMDVINMSLGGGYHGAQDLETTAVDNLDKAGIVVAVAAGNSGPGYLTVESPGSAGRALTAGASSVGQYIGLKIIANSQNVAGAAVGDFPVPTSDITARLGVVSDGSGGLSTACTALPAGSLSGRIALVSRGTCSFSQKIYDAEQAGALAAVVVNNVAGDPVAMATTAGITTTIPAAMASLSDESRLMALDGQTVTLGKDLTYNRTGNDNLFADFSSWGPTRVDYRVKPDVVAPGVNVLSSIPLQFCKDASWVDQYGCWAFLQGTSMATPHLAGMAAVVRSAHPTWDAWQVRSAIVNTAKQNGVIKTTGSGIETDVQKVGAGLADLKAAVNADVALSQVSVSFGRVAPGEGTQKRTVTISNLTAGTLTLPVSVEDSTGAGSFSVSARSVTIPGGGARSVTVSFTRGRAASGQTQAFLHVGTEHAALYAYMS
ncbi:MAG TPA: S8 family serine peptidase [Propionibacteriaceae bacterium]|nr:S8 family serine peptidase [Propionibacteriaceae bacterium]